MVSYVFIYSDVYLMHRPPRGEHHPENPKRLVIAIEALKRAGLWRHDAVIEPRPCSVEELELVHEKDYVLFVRRAIELGYRYIDADTYVSEGSWQAALHAFGGSIQGVELVKEGKDLVFVLTRPPGHHAGRAGRALGAPTQGFCLFNNIAGAITAAKLRYGLKPVLVIDIDVHHGNGTQEIFWYDPEVLHVDFHEYGIYPGTGDVNDVGGGEAVGTKINIPLREYATSDDYVYAWIEIVDTIFEKVKPRLIAVSAGFDAYVNDGLAMMELDDRFYYFAGYKLWSYAKEIGMGIIVVLEGGYSEGLRRGLPSFVKGFVEHDESKIESILRETKPRRSATELVSKIKNNVIERYL